MEKEKTMAEIYNGMTPEQQLCVAFYVNKALEALENEAPKPPKRIEPNNPLRK